MKLKEIIEYRNKFPFYKDMPCFINGMRLNSTPKINEEGFLSAYYWRDGGLWGCDAIEIYPNVYCFSDECLHILDLKKVKPETLDIWKESNGCFAPPCETVEEALETTDKWVDEVHKMIKI